MNALEIVENVPNCLVILNKYALFLIRTNCDRINSFLITIAGSEFPTEIITNNNVPQLLTNIR